MFDQEKFDRDWEKFDRDFERAGRHAGLLLKIVAAIAIVASIAVLAAIIVGIVLAWNNFS